jgi:nitric oxide reductase NorD protein
VTELLAIERRLALFAQAITGQPYEVRPAESFTGHALSLRGDDAMLDAHALYLPARIDAAAAARRYRLLSLHQLGYREFGTFRFRLATLRERSAALQALPAPPAPLRESDFDALFAQFAAPSLARALFYLFEAHRIDNHILAAYPGARGDFREEAAAELARRPPPDLIATLHGVLDALVAWSLGVPAATLTALDATGVVEPLLALGAAVAAPTADVYASAAAVVEGYTLLDRAGLVSRDLTTATEHEPTAPLIERPALHGRPPEGWLQREDRLEDWQAELAGLDAQLASAAMQGDAEDGDAAHERPTAVDVRQAADQRDMLARRIEMERTNLQHALGRNEHTGAASFLYDEWDYLAQRYLRGWCRLYERRAEPGDVHQVHELLRRIAPLQQRVQRQFQQLPLQAFQRTRRVLDGEELDWERVLEHHTDRRRNVLPDERVYSRRDRIVRDVAAAFLIDLSASTDDPIDKPEPTAEASLEDDDPLWAPAPLPPSAPSRRIIDVLRDAIALMARALERHGDRYGVYGFSGYGRDNVEYYVAKEFNEALRGHTLRALVGMRPRRSTRMGPAIRHSAAKLTHTGSALKVLIMLSDGFPQDCDYGPDRSDHEYGVADTARALAEAARAGVQTFCLTVDRSGHDYLKRMCPDDRYMVIEDIDALPDALTKVYEKLTT